MARKCLECFALIVLLQFVAQAHLQNSSRRELGGNNHVACEYVHCEKTESCVHRRFRCKNPPCPGMLYCAKSRTESLRGPLACDTVHCSTGYLCMVKVRHCLWDQKCKQQIARCVSQQEYHESPASCAGFKCPQGHRCILRESLCANPPCKLQRSCSNNTDVHIWFDECRRLGCSSEFDCFLRRPENTCSSPPCGHTPDCITTAEDEAENAHCRGWTCPRTHKCVARTATPCVSNNCDVNRTCNMIPRNHSSSSVNATVAAARHNVPKQIAATSQNEDARETQIDDFSFNVPEAFKYLSIDNYELPSLWTESEQNFESEASAGIGGFSEITETVSADVLETLIKSLAHFPNETAQGDPDEKSFDQSHPESRNESHNSSAVPYFGEDRFTSKNLEEVVEQSSLYDGARINFTYNPEPRVRDAVRSADLADRSQSSDDASVPSVRGVDANDEAADLDRFFEMDKEALLSFIEALIEEIDLENDPPNETKRNMDVDDLETDPRTAEPSYEDKELRSFYNLPSYGASDN